MRDELLANGWTLPPYTDAAHDFRHAAMHRMVDWPVLAQVVAARNSDARRLDSRMVAALYCYRSLNASVVLKSGFRRYSRTVFSPDLSSTSACMPGRISTIPEGPSNVVSASSTNTS